MNTFKELAKNLGINETLLKGYACSAHKFYREYYLPKKRKGEKRRITSPNKILKNIQKWVLNEVLLKEHIHPMATGFAKGKSIKTNAIIHLSKKHLLSLDIKNFFPSIKRSHVIKVFRKIFQDEDLCIGLTRLTTYRNSLPQGAPTSPALSNIVFFNIDNKIFQICQKRNISYSRYADDLTFGANNKGDLLKIYPIIIDILKHNGFTINTNKTKFMSAKNRMNVTGLNLNKGIAAVPRSIKRELRAKLHSLIVKKENLNKNSLAGYLSYIRSIEPNSYNKFKKYIKSLKKKSI